MDSTQLRWDETWAERSTEELRAAFEQADMSTLADVFAQQVEHIRQLRDQWIETARESERLRFEIEKLESLLCRVTARAGNIDSKPSEGVLSAVVAYDSLDARVEQLRDELRTIARQQSRMRKQIDSIEQLLRSLQSNTPPKSTAPDRSSFEWISWLALIALATAVFAAVGQIFQIFR